jgi:hypothetical protein
MANWALVENDEVTGVYDLLPKNWKHISGLRLAADDLVFLKSLGWYPVDQQHNLINFNPITHQLDGYNYELQNDVVVETPKIIEKEVKELSPIEIELAQVSFMAQLRQERDARLQKTDWTQLSDVQDSFDDEMKAKWILYRQKLRDLPQQGNDVNFSIENILWPEL